MNYRGSYRHLIRNSRAAMIAAIEIYNKPQFEYRDECFAIMLLNSWELALKAIISRNKQSIYYRKRRNEPYRTVSLIDAFRKASPFFPPTVNPIPVRRNLGLLTTYRDNAVHFYNERDFGVLIYALAQTSIINYRDLLLECFGHDLAASITWQLMPLGMAAPIDPVTYIRRAGGEAAKPSAALMQFLAELEAAAKEVEGAGLDLGRLLTVFEVHLQSTKKISSADVIVGISRENAEEGPLVVDRVVDPNVSHPLRRKDILQRVGSLHGRPFTAHTFEAIAWRYQLKDKRHLCWRAAQGGLTVFSSEVVSTVARLTQDEVDSAVEGYNHYLKLRRARS